MTEIQKYAKSLSRHPGVPIAAACTLMGFIAGASKAGDWVIGGLIGAAIMSVFWVPVLWAARDMRNIAEHPSSAAVGRAAFRASLIYALCGIFGERQ